MSQYEESGGRLLEWLIGLAAIAVGLVFVGLIWILVSEASLSVASVLGGALLAFIGYWFLALAWRLFSGKKNEHGGLLSNSTIKVFSVILGIAGMGMFILGVLEKDYGLAVSGLLGIPAWWAGWKLASKRKQGVEI